jgi:hypothetical protein
MSLRLLKRRLDLTSYPNMTFCKESGVGIGTVSSGFRAFIGLSQNDHQVTGNRTTAKFALCVFADRLLSLAISRNKGSHLRIEPL